MPKKTLGFCALCAATPATAATCAPGYYLVDGACQLCSPQNEAFYCPGDDGRYPCPRTDTDYNTVDSRFILRFISGVWARYDAKSPTADCFADIYMQDKVGNLIAVECSFNGTNYWCAHQMWYSAVAGYYLSPYWYSTGNNWYWGVKECTNAPAHAHYTGPGTPDEPRAGGATDYNDCPWACDDGYGRVGNACEPLCPTGITHLRAGSATAPLFPTRYTTPTLVVRTSGGICYGNLTPGQGTGINIRLDGNTYRVE